MMPRPSLFLCLDYPRHKKVVGQTQIAMQLIHFFTENTSEKILNLNLE